MPVTDIPTMTIPVIQMRLGMVIVEGHNRHTPITKLTPCTQRDKVHVNGTMCYDYCASVDVTIVSANSVSRRRA